MLKTINQQVAEWLAKGHTDIALAMAATVEDDGYSLDCWKLYVNDHLPAGGLWLTVDKWKEGNVQHSPEVVAFVLDNDGDTPDDCPHCHGAGTLDHMHTCHACSSTGKRKVTADQWRRTYIVDVNLRCEFSAGPEFDGADIEALFRKLMADESNRAALIGEDGEFKSLFGVDADYIDTPEA